MELVGVVGGDCYSAVADHWDEADSCFDLAVSVAGYSSVRGALESLSWLVDADFDFGVLALDFVVGELALAEGDFPLFWDLDFRLC